MSEAPAPIEQDASAQSRRWEPPWWLEWGVLALVALSCCQVGYVGHPRYGPFIAAADVLCAGLLVLWALLALRSGRLRRLPRPTAPVVAWIAVAILSVSAAALDAEGALSRAGIKAGVIEIAQIFLYFVFAYMLCADVLNDLGRLRRACIVLLGATTVTVLWALAHYLLEAEAFDVRGGFGNRNVYSAFLVVVMPLLLGVFVHERDRRLRYWSLALVPLAMLTMLGPPHVWLMAALCAWVAYVRGEDYRRILMPGILFLALAINIGLPRNHQANVVELFDPYERGELYKLETGGVETAEFEGEEGAPSDTLIVKKRWLEWQPALAMMSENIALGVGAGSYQRRIGETAYYGALPNVKKSEPDTNNFYLVIGASMGFAGLVCVVAMLALYWRWSGQIWLRAGSRIERGLGAGLPAAIVGIALANLFTSLFVRGCGTLWALVFAMALVAIRESSSGRNATTQQDAS